MTRLGWLLASFAIIVFAAAAGLLIWHHSRTESQSPEAAMATTTAREAPADPSVLSIYTNGAYGFSLFYPSDAVLSDSFASSTSGRTAWRSGSDSAGLLLLRIQRGTQMLQVGTASSSSAVSECTTADPAETKGGPVAIGSTTWQSFSFDKIGTDDTQRVTSYRTVYQRSCFALELFEPSAGVSSSTGYTLRDSLMTFSFAH